MSLGGILSLPYRSWLAFLGHSRIPYVSCSGPVLVNRAEPECRIAGIGCLGCTGCKGALGASRAQGHKGALGRVQAGRRFLC